MTEEQVELIALKTGEHLVDKFSDVVSEKIQTAIELHEARNMKILDERFDKHIKECPVGLTIKLTTTKIITGLLILVALSGGSAEIARKLIELLAKIL